MEGIRTAIELQDHFSGVLMNIINTVNLSVSAMEQMQAVMSGPVDTAAIQEMREQLDDASLAAQELNAALQSVEFSGTVHVPEIPEVPDTDSGRHEQDATAGYRRRFPGAGNSVYGWRAAGWPSGKPYSASYTSGNRTATD